MARDVPRGYQATSHESRVAFEQRSMTGRSTSPLENSGAGMATMHRGEPTKGQSTNGQSTRCYIDDHGVNWRVFERHLEGGADCLIFESEGAYRRVRAYPADWRALSSQELTRLSWRR
jgi:hypothetical protein